MQLEKVKVGMKVVPHSKTAGGNINNSYVMRRMVKDKAEFLYVTTINKKDKTIILHNKKTIGYIGDFFRAEDFEPYVKTKHTDNAETLD